MLFSEVSGVPSRLLGLRDIASVSGNWGAKGGDVLEKHIYERLKVLTLCWPRGREKLLLQKITQFSLT